MLRMNAQGEYEMILNGAETILLTQGEIMAAAEWGIWFQFDSSVPRTMQSKVMRNQVHHVLADQFDKQLTMFGKADRLSDDRKRDAYARIEQSEQSIENMPDGILAEKMLMSLLTKEIHDGDLPFSVQSVDVYEDMEHKIDIITVNDTRRGVKTEVHEQKIGIQFTLSKSYATLAHKNKQLSRVRKHLNETEVDELILVSMPIDDIRSIFERWRYNPDGSHKKTLDPRGPDHLWSPETKKQIINHLVRGIGLENAKVIDSYIDQK